MSKVIRFAFVLIPAFTVLSPLIVEASAPQPLREWSDSTGRFTLDARFVRVDGMSVVLRLENGTIRRVELARLSKRDQEYVMELQPVAAKPIEQAGNGDLAEFPKTLPELPEALPEETRNTLMKMNVWYEYSPVVCYFMLREFFQDDKERLARVWVRKTISEIEPFCVSIVLQDLDTAIKAQDYRNASIAAVVATRIDEHSLDRERKERLLALQRQAIAGQGNQKPMWQLDRVRASFVGAATKFRLTPRDEAILKQMRRRGHLQVHVNATVTNISDSKELKYAHFAMDDIRSLLFMFQKTGRAEGNLILSEFIHAITPNGDVVRTLHVCESSHAIIGNGIKIAGDDGRWIPMGSYVKKGDSFQVDVIFLLPENITGLQLFVLGASPANVERLW